uniref:Beta-1,4-endoglucanase 2 n=1 Tax=Globodera tabacum solanacearum TaxID=65955 RepID=Q9U6M4_GLOTB|nr:beta-1,4-endoglucanase 2 precursor [Globodera tabacum solanacearum]
MCRLQSLFFHVFLLHALHILFCNALTATPPPYGRLSVSGTKLVGSNGQPVQLIGNSLFWHQFQSQYWNAETVKALKCNWNANVVRAAVGVDLERGYMSDPTTAYNLAVAVIEAAISQGMYVIVDWHSHEAHVDKAVEFFTKIAKAYGSYPHVLYETFNEPLQGVSWTNILVPYHKKVIAAIRALDAKNVIILGTPTWCQDVHLASQNPIKEYKNLMYTFHFYASTHFVNGLGAKLQTAINNGLPIFVTEYGTCAADGNGNIDTNSISSWWTLLDNLKISYLNWAISDKSESCSALKPGTPAANVGVSSAWTTFGNLVAAHDKKKSTGVSCSGATPARGSSSAGKPAPAKKPPAKSSKAAPAKKPPAKSSKAAPAKKPPAKSSKAAPAKKPKSKSG